MKPIIEVNNLSKEYRIATNRPNSTLRDSLASAIKHPRSLINPSKHDANHARNNYDIERCSVPLLSVKIRSRTF